METPFALPPIRKVAMLGSFVPRMCGIATFTTDLSNAILAAAPGLELSIIAMNDLGLRHAYPDRVRFEIAENDVSSYRRAADYLNVNDVDTLCVQHEYGIYGGRAGGHLLTLLRELRMPIVTTFHTLLSAPNDAQRAVLNEVARFSTRSVVMTRRGAEILSGVHGVPNQKIDLIPHGIPSVPFDCPDKDKLGLEGKRILLTFGLLSPDKGIENVIEALPAILKEHPTAVYVVLGATHPHVREHQGEMYRLGLEQRAARLGVGAHVVFHNRFVTSEELAQFLSASDVYITPYLKAEQTTSGTLAYAVGSGRAVVSTPYWHAQELLAEGRGILVPWQEPQAIARAVNGLLGDETARLTMRRRAAAMGQGMLWPTIGRSYLETIERARQQTVAKTRQLFEAKTLAKRPGELPELNLAHLRLMTDSTGLLQHAAFTFPQYQEGYCLDDNARALLLMTLVEDASIANARDLRDLASRYLSFVNFAFDNQSGRFRNFLSYARTWAEGPGSEDSHGRALWALGNLVGRAGEPGRRSLASRLFHAALPQVHHFSSPRAWAFTLLGIDEYLRAFKGDRSVQRARKLLTERLLDCFRASSAEDWPWFEAQVTYSNARLCQALLASGEKMEDQGMVEIGLRTLSWLTSIQRTGDGHFAPIGSNGFYPKGGIKAASDQQPLEACGMVSACLEALRVTGDARWSEVATQTFNWFLGENHLRQALYDAQSGGCSDGLHTERINENQGAESTLSFLLALTEMYSANSMTAPSPKES